MASSEWLPPGAKGLCCVFYPFMPHSHAKLFRLHCNCENVGGNSPLLCPASRFFFTLSSPVLCKLLLWQHVALVFMAGCPFRSVPIRLMTLGPRPGMMMLVIIAQVFVATVDSASTRSN